MMLKRPEPIQHIPKEAEKVFAGVLFDVYHWQQEMFDGTKATFEALRREDSVVIIPVTADGKVVVSHEQQPGTGWFETLPCGGIEKGETPEEAAIRELAEETGYVPERLELWFSHQISSRIDWAIYIFVAHGVRRHEKAHSDRGERIETREVAFDELLRLAGQSNFQNVDITPRLLSAALDPKEMESLKRLLGVY